MYRKEEYNRKLMELIKKYKITSINERYKMVLERKILLETQRFQFDKEILEDCETLIGRKIYYVISFNENLYRLLRKDFGLERNDFFLELAVKYTLYGCMFDTLFDEHKGLNHEEYIESLEGLFLGEKNESKPKNILEKHFFDLNDDFNGLAETYKEIHGQIKSLSARAIRSEIYVSKHNVYEVYRASEELVKDKSDKFTVTGILLALMDVELHKLSQLICCAQQIGEIVLIIDDLSDLYDDILNQTINSIVYDTGHRIEQEDDYIEAIDIIMESLEVYVQKIDANIQCLSKDLSVETMDYIRFLITNWMNNIICSANEVQES